MGNTKSQLKTLKKKRHSTRQNKLFKTPNYAEIDRQNLWHFVIANIFEGRFLAPIEQELIKGSCKILDGGCGSGAWVLDMASDYVDSEFYGIDKLPGFPREIKPKNVRFSIEDILSGLSFDNDSVLFIRVSLMCSSFTKDEYHKFLVELLRVLKPGGYIEITEPHMIPNEYPENYRHLLKTLQLIYPNSMLNLNTIETIIELLEDTKLVKNVKKDMRTTTLGPSDGVVGSIILDLIHVFFVDVIPNICAEMMGMTLDEYLAYWQICKDELIQEKTGYSIVKILAQKVVV